MKTDLEQQLLHRGIQPTAMRVLVLEVLQNSPYALSLADIEQKLDTAERATIFRSLKTMEQNKLIHAIQDGSGATKYATCESYCLCTIAFSHAHFHCNNCLQTFCLQKIKVPEVSLPKNFASEQISFVIKGICDRCGTK